MGKVMSNVRFLLVRHGETTWNQENRWQGQADVPLSDTGRAQARLLAQRFLGDGRQVHAIYASDLSRAFETAEILSDTLRLPPNPDTGWREMNIGVWSGLTTAQVIERHSGEWERLRAGEDLPRGGGETFAQFQGRIIQSAQLLAQRHAGEQIVIVTHGGAVRAFLLYCRNLPTTKFREIDKIGNTGVSEVTFSLAGETIIHSVNDVSHLSGSALVGETVDA
jgi:broad specificity phosphatase PhoE